MSGFVVFLPKYIETQFGTSKSEASLFTGKAVLTLLHSEGPKLFGVLAILSAAGFSVFSSLLLLEVKDRAWFIYLYGETIHEL